MYFVLKKLVDNNFEAYVVGGYVRDMLLGKVSNDIDICTNAKPFELVSLFNVEMPKEEYNSIVVNNIEITTFRKEIEYKERKPIKIEFVSDLLTDLKRRDFTINTICLDINNNVIDLLNGVSDLEKKLIRTVIDSDLSFKLDPLRMLRAIRFMLQLDFDLSSDIIDSIIRNRALLGSLSNYRIKQELDKIFLYEKSFDVLIEFGIDKVLGFDLSNVVFSSLVGIWAQLDVEFSDSNNIIRDLINREITAYDIYKYSYDVCIVAANIRNQNISDDLVIRSRNDIKVSIDEIRLYTSNVNEAYIFLEKGILNNGLLNDNVVLNLSLKEKYGKYDII